MTTRPIERTAPADQLSQAVRDLAGTVAQRATSSVTDRVNATTRRLNEFASSDATAQRKEMSTMKTKMTTKLSGAGQRVKAAIPRQRGSESGPEQEPRENRGNPSDVVASVDVGVSPAAACRAWANDSGVEIVDETPGERILWRDDRHAIEGATTFHELAPTLTRVMLVVEHHPRGLSGRVTGRARGRARRARRELRDFQRRVMAETVLHGEDEQRRPARSKRGKKGASA